MAEAEATAEAAVGAKQETFTAPKPMAAMTAAMTDVAARRVIRLFISLATSRGSFPGGCAHPLAINVLRAAFRPLSVHEGSRIAL